TASYSRALGESVVSSPYTISAVLSPAAVLGNYTITYNTANFTITKADATVTAVDNSKVYGTADPALATTNSGFLAADLGATKITFSASRAAGETVAGSSYVITPSADDHLTGLLNNYTVLYVNGSFTIDKAPASVTPDPKTKVYGTADPVLTGSLSGF